MIKIDFTNVLEQEIVNTSEIISAIENEIAVRKREDENPSSELAGTTGYKPILSPIDAAVNVRVIAELSSNLRGKKDWLKKLKEKREIDQAEVDQEFEECTTESIQEILEKGLKIKDLHDKARFDYIKIELELWMEKRLDPAYKEASVFYYRALKELTINN